ncbi:MAG: AAA family ATPase [Candidatus Humimicrobiaceae bacterium]
MSQNEPSLPSIYITSIDVSNSKFMGPIFLEFNRQYNSLIGGRGTGKSTILEYLRWGLCDQPPETLKGEELPEYQERRKNLIQKTLFPFNATVQISFIKNGVPHITKRKSDTCEIFLKIGDGDFELCKESDVRNLLPVQAYSQKQLSSVGVSLEELKRLVYSPIRQELNEYNAKFKELSSEIRNCYEIIQSKELINKEIMKDDLELKSLDEQLSLLKKGLKGLSSEAQQIITAHANYESADEQVKAWQREISTISQDIKTLIGQLEGYPSKIRLEVKLPEVDANIISSIEATIKDIFNNINEKAKAIDKLLFDKNDKIVKVNEEVLKWQKIYDEYKTSYENAKKQSTSQEQTLEQISRIEGRLKELRANLAEKKEAINRKGDPEAKFDSLSISWLNLHNSRADIIAKQCFLLNSLSNGNLKANLGRGKGTNNLEEKLIEHFQGAKIQREKIEKLCNRIKESKDSIKEWINILKELELLANIDLKEEASTSLPVTPILYDIGFIKSELQRIVGKLINENWIDLFLIELEDIPIFDYKTKDNEYIDFSDASAGQQATSLMHILLNQEDPPLIIDQPEEDLDNEMVYDIAELIWNAKTRRQIIFASHNANIVVNGDAELVVCCRYLIAVDQSKGTIDNQGAIDVPIIKDEITRIMEGGERAFRLRKEKYGF